VSSTSRQPRTFARGTAAALVTYDRTHRELNPQPPGLRPASDRRTKSPLAPTYLVIRGTSKLGNCRGGQGLTSKIDRSKVPLTPASTLLRQRPCALPCLPLLCDPPPPRRKGRNVTDRSPRLAPTIWSRSRRSLDLSSTRTGPTDKGRTRESKIVPPVPSTSFAPRES
jgi:hypothetical protein